MADAAAPPPAIAISLKEEAATAAPPERIELSVTAPNTAACDVSPTDEIVVCAPDSAVYRLGPVSTKPGQALPKTELKLSGNTVVAAHLQSGNLGNMPTNRAMVTIKVAF